MKTARSLFLGALSFAAFLLAGCAYQQSVPASPDVLRIGVTPNSPPMIYKQGGEITGLEADFGRALAKEMGRKPVFVERKWDNLLPSVGAGQVDIVMSNVTITPERRAMADFSEPYLRVGQMLLVRNNEYGFYQDPKIIMIVNKKIGVEPGTVSDAWLQRNCLKATRVPISSPESGAKAVASGKIDAFLHDAPVIWRLSSAHASQGVTMVRQPLGADYLGWAVRRGDSTTLKATNAALKKWQKNGYLNRTINRWMPVNQ